MNFRRILGWIIVIFLIFWVVTRPEGAANSVQNAGNILRDAGESISTFFTELI